MNFKNFGDWWRNLSRCGRRTITRLEAADMIDEFCEMKWQYADEFDLAFGDKFDDPILKSTAKEFLEIQADYEKNVKITKGMLSEEHLSRLRNLSVILRSNVDETEA